MLIRNGFRDTWSRGKKLCRSSLDAKASERQSIISNFTSSKLNPSKRSGRNPWNWDHGSAFLRGPQSPRTFELYLPPPLSSIFFLSTPASSPQTEKDKNPFFEPLNLTDLRYKRGRNSGRSIWVSTSSRSAIQAAPKIRTFFLPMSSIISSPSTADCGRKMGRMWWGKRRESVRAHRDPWKSFDLRNLLEPLLTSGDGDEDIWNSDEDEKIPRRDGLEEDGFGAEDGVAGELLKSLRRDFGQSSMKALSFSYLETVEVRSNLVSELVVQVGLDVSHLTSDEAWIFVIGVEASKSVALSPWRPLLMSFDTKPMRFSPFFIPEGNNPAEGAGDGADLEECKRLKKEGEILTHRNLVEREKWILEGVKNWWDIDLNVSASHF